MKRILSLASCLVLMFSLMGIASTSFAAGKKKEHVMCPTCESEAVRVPRPKGGARTYYKHVCPSCKTEHSAESTGGKIHVCEKCGVELNECPTCESKN